MCIRDRLRMDYFAIVTISLGEIVRVLLMGEPLLRAGSWGSSIGISRYPMPLEGWWFCGSDGPVDATGELLDASDCSDVVGIGSPAELLGRSSAEYSGVDILNGTGGVIQGDIMYEATWYSMELGEPAPYMMLLAVIGITSLIAIWWPVSYTHLTLPTKRIV